MNIERFDNLIHRKLILSRLLPRLTKINIRGLRNLTLPRPFRRHHIQMTQIPRSNPSNCIQRLSYHIGLLIFKIFVTFYHDLVSFDCVHQRNYIRGEPRAILKRLNFSLRREALVIFSSCIRISFLNKFTKEILFLFRNG